VSAVTAAPLLIGRVMKVIFDQNVIAMDPPQQGERTFVILTSAISPQIAKSKSKLYILTSQRPFRRVIDIKVEMVERGVILKKFKVTIVTSLIERTGSEENA